MKNIHLLPTEIPGRFSLKSNGEYCLSNYSYPDSPNFKNQNIYITSDEEIKEGDVVKIPCGVGKVKELFWKFGNDNPSYIVEDIFIYKLRYGQKEGELQINSFRYEDVKKITLTTDQDLIKDGVQEIDDEFLEWFVKNPSCEFVMTIPDVIGLRDVFQPTGKDLYKIIIPKEEPKQIKCYDKFNQILKEGDYVDVQKDGIYKIYKKEDGQLYFNLYSGEDKVSNYFSNDMVKCDKDGNWITNNQYKDIDEHKQETFEDAAKDFIENTMKFSFTSNDTKTLANRMLKCVEFGAKWQQEQNKNLYSEEELLRFGKSCFYKGFDKAENDDANCYTAFREEISSLFEKFKME